jgi:hypothetical protein
MKLNLREIAENMEENLCLDVETSGKFDLNRDFHCCRDSFSVCPETFFNIYIALKPAEPKVVEPRPFLPALQGPEPAAAMSSSIRISTGGSEDIDCEQCGTGSLRFKPAY